MNPTISPKNYDPLTRLNSYRRLKQHPDERTKALAEAFANDIAVQRGILPPASFWFEEADFGVASKEWFANSKRKNEAADPLREECEYFRRSNSSGRCEPEHLDGYVYGDQPRGVLMNADLRGEDLLKMVAHTCFLFWNSGGPHFVRERAEKWVRSEDTGRAICVFLEQWTSRHSYW